MASNILLISGGTNYYISGGSASQTVYAGSGTPWTAQTTTPYEIGMNQTVGATWTPLAAVRQEVYGGGPPFRDGQTILYDSYGNVTESVTIQCRATTHDNAMTLLRQLRQILNTALYSTPCTLAVQPNNATNTVYYDIYGADVQEDARFINEEAGVGSLSLVRAVVTWRRSPMGGASSLATLINAATFTNVGTGANNNTQTLGTLTGDLVYEGQPLNIRFNNPSSIVAPDYIYLATVESRVYSSVAQAVTTSSTTGQVYSSSPSAVTLTSMLTGAALKMRVIGRLSSLTNPSRGEMRVTVVTTDIASAWVPVYNSTSAQIIDFGTIDITGLKTPLASTLTAAVSAYLRSNDGNSTSATLDYLETIIYYDMARIESAGLTAARHTQVIGANQAVSGGPWLPAAPPKTQQVITASFIPTDTYFTRGTFPRAYSGASLYVNWTGAGYIHDKTDTSAITVTHAPLYRTLRGGG